MESGKADVWIARPQEVGDAQMRLLELTLGASEIARASKFRFESDRRAYVVAHGVRRIALGDVLGVDPAGLVLAKQGSGKPVLIWPRTRKVFFSHAHSRELVAVGVSSTGPVGIDVESIAQAEPDFELLTPYVVLPEVSRRAVEVGVDPAAQFFFYWTALEAFWKSAGKGLALENPRIYCEKNDAGTFEITLEVALEVALEGGGKNSRTSPCASVSRVQASEGCVISLVQQYQRNWADRADAGSLYRTSKCKKKDDFFMQAQRHQDNGAIRVVSV